MEAPYKILILDDEADWLELCRDVFAQLPSKPEIRTCTSSSRALGMLDSEPYRLLILDLKMPRMDGLQVLSVVRRRYPELRTVVLSGLEDEELRSRAYALGADLYWLKNDMQRDSKMFLECLESLLGRDLDGGFRGIQSKGLMDIIQLECLSRSSTVLRITRGPLVGKLWFQNGELLDAEAEGARGEMAFRRILSWKSGSFENLPAEPSRERTITKPINALLLESAQTMDENANPASETQFIDARHRHTVWKLSLLVREGADFVIAVPPEGQGEPEAIGTQAVDLAAWTRHTTEVARQLGEKMEAGPLLHLTARSQEKRLAIFSSGNRSFLIGWPLDVADKKLLENSKRIVASWDS